MKKKTGMYLVIGIIGIALALIAKFLLQDYLSDSQSGAMIGIGAGLFGYGIAKWGIGLWGTKNPDLMKLNEIEEKDERNQLIRNKAQAISGEILHWLLMAGAWVCIFFRHTNMDSSYPCRRFPAENNHRLYFEAILPT